MEGILIVAHGSRGGAAWECLEDVSQALRRRGCQNVYAACMQLSPPFVAEVLDRMVCGGVTDITVLPLFLYSGRHLAHDLPRQVQEAAARYPGVAVRFARPLAGDERLADILLTRIQQAKEGD